MAVVNRRSAPRKKRKVIVQIATSADGYIARPDGDHAWLSERPHPKGMYGMGKFIRSIDTILFGRKTYDIGLQMGAKFDPSVRNYVFSRQLPPSSVPKGVEFVNQPIAAFAKRLRETEGKDIWMMGGADIIASFLDAGEIDEFLIAVIPTFIGEGIPLVAPRHRDVPLRLLSVHRFPDGVQQVHYSVQNKSVSSGSTRRKARTHPA
jgi:dihydrofolate reductase